MDLFTFSVSFSSKEIQPRPTVLSSVKYVNKIILSWTITVNNHTSLLGIQLHFLPFGNQKPRVNRSSHKNSVTFCYLKLSCIDINPCISIYRKKNKICISLRIIQCMFGHFGKWSFETEAGGIEPQK